MRIAMWTGLIVAVVLTVMIWQRHFILLSLASLMGTPPLIDANSENPEARWFDDYLWLRSSIRAPLPSANHAIFSRTSAI